MRECTEKRLSSFQANGRGERRRGERLGGGQVFKIVILKGKKYVARKSKKQTNKNKSTMPNKCTHYPILGTKPETDL